MKSLKALLRLLLFPILFLTHSFKLKSSLVSLLFGTLFLSTQCWGWGGSNNPEVSITASASHAEGDSGTTSIALTIAINKCPNKKKIKIKWETSDAGGSATSGTDYIYANGSIKFNTYSCTKTHHININIKGDTDVEPDETFKVKLSDNGTKSTQKYHFNPDHATITIENDDSGSGGSNTPPVADAGADQNVIQDENVTMDGSGSSDDGGISSYSWKVNGHTYSGVNPTIKGSDLSTGDNTVTLTVTDDSGQTDTDTMVIHVMEIVENADDLCYEEMQTDGLVCIGMGPCAGGVGCKKTYPLKNIGDSNLTDAEVVYDEGGMGGSFGSNCGVDPSGSCSTQNDYQMGPMSGGFSKATVYEFDDPITPNNSNTDIWTKAFISGSCFSGNNLYGNYVKDGKYHRGALKPCDSNKSYDESNPRPFTKTNPNTNIFGDLLVIGNQSLCWKDGGTTCKAPPAGASNNSYYQEHINLDSVATAAGYINSTMAKLELNASDKVIGAWLFWMGRIYTSNNTEKAKRELAKTIKFKTPTSNGYVSVQADKYNWMVDSKYFDYGAIADVTDLVKEKGEYWVADLQATEMSNQGSGWSLAVVVEDLNQTTRTLKNISLYDGFLGVYNNSSSYPNEIGSYISGFYTPKSGTVNSNLIVFTSESDRSLNDTMSVAKKDGSDIKIKDSLNDTNNVQNGTISRNGANVTDRLPNFANTLGVDIDEVNVSQIIDNQQTDTTIKLESKGDRIFVSMYGFATELYIPKLCYDYTLDIGGYVLDSKDNKIQTPFGGYGVPLRTHLYVKSLEGDLSLTDVNISYRIHDTNQLRYKRGSTEIAENGQFNYVDASTWTTNETDAGYSMYIGTGKTSSSGGVIEANEARYIKHEADFVTSQVDTYFDFDVYYNIDYGSGGIPIHKHFTQNDLCESNGSFNVEYGLFNVVDESADNIKPQYNLYTQVSGRPFNLKVFVHDDTDPYKLSSTDVNLSVEIEMIRADDFIRNINVSCADEHAVLDANMTKAKQRAKFVHINGKYATFGYDASDIDFAYRSLAMRVWYLVNVDGSLIDNHDCTRNNQSACETLYHNTFASLHECDSECTAGGSGCYDCLRSYHGAKVCSRDNFAIRPEAFITDLKDSNQSTDTTQASHSIMISKQGHTNEGKVIAGYNYRFDVNATSQISDSAVSKYIQQFTEESLGHLAQMKWNGPTNGKCNDVEDKNISFNIYNGSTVNKHTHTAQVDKVNQIGEYLFHITDTNWTSADWDDEQMAHHTTSPNSAYFRQGNDCLYGSDISTNGTNAKETGCNISSLHNGPNGRYIDLKAMYYPYTFDVTNLAFGGGPSNDKTFIYTNTLDSTLYPNGIDENMSYNIQGTFHAVGYTSAIVNNFVDGCYAENINMTLRHAYLSDVPTNTPNLTADLLDFNTSNPSLTYPSNDSTDRKRITFNNTLVKNTQTPLSIVQNKNIFVKDMQGAITMDLGFNFDRTNNQPLNPRLINFSDFNITYATQPNINVDMKTDYHIYGEKKIDANITFIYGRAKPGKLLYDDVTTASIITPVSVVFYCDLGYTECQKRGVALMDAQTNEAYWWKSVDHDNQSGKDGNIVFNLGSPTEGSGSPTISATSATITSDGEDNSIKVSKGSNPVLPLNIPINLIEGDPTSATPAIYTDRWLIYNPDSATKTPSPFYRVRFIGNSTWSGIGKTGNVVGNDAGSKKTKRLDW